MDYYCAADQGLVRSENQDRVMCWTAGSGLVMVVCDGMGGENSGGVASELAVTNFYKTFQEMWQSYEPYAIEGNYFEIRKILLSAVSSANQVVFQKAKLEYEHFGMGTTCVAAYICGQFIDIVNVGDSRAYLLREDELEQVTVDDTKVQQMLDDGDITPIEAAHHPYRHVLIKAVGVDSVVRPTEGKIDLPPGAPVRLMLCSDGLCGYVDDEKIKEILRQDKSAQELTQLLIDAANEAGGKDNVSVAVAIGGTSEGE